MRTPTVLHVAEIGIPLATSAIHEYTQCSVLAQACGATPFGSCAPVLPMYASPGAHSVRHDATPSIIAPTEPGAQPLVDMSSHTNFAGSAKNRPTSNEIVRP